MVPTLLAQVVLTLRFVFFCGNGLVLIVAKLSRIYAVTNKSRIITSCFCIITISQFSLGLHATVYAAKAGRESVIRLPAQLSPTSFSAVPIPSVPLPVYMACIFVWQLSMGLAFIIMSLAYGTEPLLPFVQKTRYPDHLPDVLAFSVIVFLVVRSNVTKVPLPGILKTIARDATCYFLIIFTSHFVTAMFFLFAGVSRSS